jgi:multiple sugar transport system substrate-binding protein
LHIHLRIGRNICKDTQIFPHESSFSPEQNPAPDYVTEVVRANSDGAISIGRRDFIRRTGLAVAGLTAASTILSSARRVLAAGSKTEITFSSAKFFGKETIAEVVEAFNEFVRWMSSPETQLRFATQLGLCPTRAAVLDDPKIAQEQPFMEQLKSVFVGAIGRPVTPKYPQVTLVLQSAVSTALTTGEVKPALKAAADKIQAIVKT